MCLCLPAWHQVCANVAGSVWGRSVLIRCVPDHCWQNNHYCSQKITIVKMIISIVNKITIIAHKIIIIGYKTIIIVDKIIIINNYHCWQNNCHFRQNNPLFDKNISRTIDILLLFLHTVCAKTRTALVLFLPGVSYDNKM